MSYVIFINVFILNFILMNVKLMVSTTLAVCEINDRSKVTHYMLHLAV